jgi:hypothetical protein
MERLDFLDVSHKDLQVLRLDDLFGCQHVDRMRDQDGQVGTVPTFRLQ